jgi:serine/threonine-protein kinase
MKPTQPAPPPNWNPALGSLPPRNIFQTGTVLSDVYEVRGLLGSGGNGQVFDAHDRLLNRRVAIKAAWSEMETRGPLLRKEAQALAAIRHPGLVSVYAMGIHEGVEYMVMEHVPGVSLESSIASRKRRGEPIRLDEALDILIAVADALAAVHRAGIAHRDVKPANIMMAPGNRIVLTDFGLMLPEFEVAQISDVRGTPAYIAPEAILREISPGEANLVDVYALGAVAFELLTGDTPFDAETIGDLLRMHVEAPIPDVPDVPPKLSALVKEMLAKEPQSRPQELESIVFRLRAIRNGLAHAEAGKGLRVLVVDDDPELGKLMGMYVRHAVPTADVALATNAKQALAEAKKKPPRLVVFDLMMPETNGMELFMMLRAEPFAEECTFVAVSAGGREADIDLLYELGVTKFVSKGTELRAKLAELAKQAQAEIASPRST